MSAREAGPAGSGRFFIPFLAGDVVLLAAAWLIYQQAGRPMNLFETVTFGVCVALGAGLGVWPFVLRHQAELKRFEVNELTTTLAQIERSEEVAHRIAVATGQWQTAQDHAARVMIAAREIADRMTAEQKEFRTFMEKAADTERGHLRLEINKLRRAEGDWLQAFVRALDHVYALYLAGMHSGQSHLIEQFSSFQNACRDAARRVGLVPVVAAPGIRFDPEVHQLMDSGTVPPEGAAVVETLATGYAFQGQLLRRALVTVLTGPPAPAVVVVESFSALPATAASPAEQPALPTAAPVSSQVVGNEAAVAEAPPPEPPGRAEPEPESASAPEPAGDSVSSSGTSGAA